MNKTVKIFRNLVFGILTLLLPITSFSTTPATHLDISKEVKELKGPRTIKRGIWYQVGDINPIIKDKNNEMMGELNFVAHLPYIDTKNFLIKIKSESGNVDILADVTGEPRQDKNDGDTEFKWMADCISSGKPDNTEDSCSVENGEPVAYGSWYIKLIAYEPAKNVEIYVEFIEHFDDINISFTIDNEPYNPAGYQIEAGKKADLKLLYRNSEGSTLDHMMYHGKMMHMVVFKPDLSHIAHIHPDYNMMTKEYSLSLNTTRPGDMDNLDLPTAIPDPGTYYMLTETMPKDHKDISMPWFKRYHFNVPGPVKPSKPLEVDFYDDDEYFDKYFKRNGKEGKEGDYLKVRMKKIYHQICFKYALEFDFNLSLWDGEKYVPLSHKHFGRWLMMPGHGIYIKEEVGKTTDVMDRHFMHAHAPALSRDGSGILNYPSHAHVAMLMGGIYKFWAQTRVQGKIFTLPFVFEVKLPVMGLESDPYGGASKIKKTACSAELN